MITNLQRLYNLVLRVLVDIASNKFSISFIMVGTSYLDLL